MKKFVVFLLSVLLITACNDKEIVTQPPLPTHPQMKYTNMNNLSIKFGQQKSLNIDEDHTNDLLFSTMLVGDPILRVDKKSILYPLHSMFFRWLMGRNKHLH